MKAEIITIGTEILLGQTLDTNSAFLGSSLAEIGIDVHRIISIADSPEAIENALDSVLESTNWVFITGGLGPTKDDLTKGVLTRYFDDELVFRSDIYEHIRDFFSKMGRSPNILNKEQVYDLTKNLSSYLNLEPLILHSIVFVILYYVLEEIL